MGIKARERIISEFELKQVAMTFQDAMAEVGNSVAQCEH